MWYVSRLSFFPLLINITLSLLTPYLLYYIPISHSERSEESCPVDEIKRGILQSLCSFRMTTKFYFMRYLKALILCFILAATLTVASSVFAAPDQPAKKQRNVELINPIGGTVEKPKGETNLQVVVGKVIKKALGVIGSLTLVVFIYGGFLWLTAAGAEDKVKQGTQAMVWAVIGICIIFGAYVILELVLKGLSGG